VIQEHEIDVLQSTRVVQSLDGSIAGPNLDLDDIAQTGQIDERRNNGSEFRVALKAIVPFTACFANGIAEENARVTDIPAEFDLPFHQPGFG